MFGQTMASIHSILGVETKEESATCDIKNAGDIEFKGVCFSWKPQIMDSRYFPRVFGRWLFLDSQQPLG